MNRLRLRSAPTRTALTVAVAVVTLAGAAACGSSDDAETGDPVAASETPASETPSSEAPTPSAAPTASKPAVPVNATVAPTGKWSMTFVVTKTGGTVVGVTIGRKSVRPWSFAKSTCDASGTCSAVVTRQYGLAASPTALTAVTPVKAKAGIWTLKGALKDNCYATSGSVAVRRGEDLALLYTFKVTKTKTVGGKLVATAVGGTLTNVLTPTAAGAAKGCKAGTITYKMTGVPR